jgi:ADP-heptose:LPS heptosyltransferase
LAKPSPVPASRSRLLVVELWGLGDLALAIPFLRAATEHARVTLLGKPHAAPLLARFAPNVEHIAFTAPWTAFRGKYRLHRWPWREFGRVVRSLRKCHFEYGVSARPDPRDHLLLALSGARYRIGFPWRNSGVFLTQSLPKPAQRHRAEHWRALANALAWKIPERAAIGSKGRHIVIHTGAAQAVRMWPAERYRELSEKLRAAGWRVTLVGAEDQNLDVLLDRLAVADWFIGNDSGPGHIAALLGVPTFTIFGPQLPELFAPQHPRAAWIEGAACPYKPCFDSCRFPEPFCIRNLSVEAVWLRTVAWLAAK